MPRRFALCFAVPLSLALLLGGGCSRSGDSKPAGSAVPDGRPLAAIWADILAQRDAIHVIFIKDPEDVTHDDCASVGGSARRLDELMTELTNRIGGTSEQGEGRLRAIGDAISRVSALIVEVREKALAEAPGAWPQFRYPLDHNLLDLESYFTADDFAHESVLNRPGFETEPLPPALSPI